jgi:hypothetical protein
MYKDKITLHTAKQLELTGHITIIDASPESLAPLGQEGIQWKQNFKALQEKVRNLSPDKILAFYNAKYSIEVADDSQKEMGVFSWRYLSGIDNKDIAAKNIDNIEYVYVLVNAGYPNLVKIGMTTKEVNSRVTGINATGTVDEWVAKFAVPISKGNAMRVEQAVHNRFSDRRVSSDLGNSREFFTLDPFTAIGAIREIAATHMVGDVIIY